MSRLAEGAFKSRNSAVKTHRFFKSLALFSFILSLGITAKASSFNPTLDANLTQEQRRTFYESIGWLQDHNLSGDSWFNKIFGSSGSSGIFDYLSARIHFLNAATDIKDQNAVGAINIGLDIWLWNLKFGDPSAISQMGSFHGPIESPRVGVIELGKTFNGRNDANIYLMSALIHEARHSDCSGGIHPADLAALKADSNAFNPRCGYQHVYSPGERQVGLKAYDEVAWGGYAVETVFLKSVMRCLNCSDDDRQMATLLFDQTKPHVLHYDEMMSGKLGQPDMTSQGLLP